MKRWFCILLTVVLLCTSVPLAVFAEAEGTTLPTVYVLGSGSGLVVDEPDGSRRRVYGIELPDDFIDTQVKGNLDVFKRAFFTQKWDEFCVVLHDVMVPLFAELKLDEHGNAPNGSHVDWTWNRDWLDGSKVGGKYPTSRYRFEYDWRMDPYKSAETLHRYIEDVLAVTGETQVNLVGRCLGACVTAAYMEKYDGQYVANYLLYAGALYGATQCSKAFCGELYLESGGIERYMYDLELFADTVYNELLQAFVTQLRKTGGLDVAAWAVNNVYRQIYMQIVPPILSETYGTFPGYWSMVADCDYEKAKATVFADADPDVWKDFLGIIDAYHYNVQVKTPELLAHYRAKGISVANIVKYGFQTIPVTRRSNILSDGMCSVTDASLGATCSTLNRTLSRKYLKTADMRFVSPDRQIDASTCLLPERTWFIKDLGHKDFPEQIERLFDEVLNHPQITAQTSTAYPQYLVWDADTQTLCAQTSDNCDTTARYRVTFFRAFVTFWRAVFTLVRRQIEQKRSVPA